MSIHYFSRSSAFLSTLDQAHFSLLSKLQFYTTPDKINLYPSPKYEVRVIKANPTAVSYGLGSFVRWEKIKAQTKDQLIVLTDPRRKGESFRFRIAFEDSKLFGDNFTKLAIEDAKTGYNQSLHLPVKEASEQALGKLLKPGATIIATPILSNSEVNLKDQDGNLLAGWLIIRQ